MHYKIRFSIQNKKSMKEKIQIILGDITFQNVDAIVNAANNSLLGGGGVDGAIHSAAGPKLLEECRLLNGCDSGEAKITKGYNLPAKHVIHTVGPIWHNGNNNEEETLRSCYKNSLQLAKKNNIKTIAFPSISTGVYGYPIEKAAKIALDEIHHFLTTENSIDEVSIICFGEKEFKIYQSELNHLK